MTVPWWDHHTPVEVMVPCSGGEHRMRWESGVLVAKDHSDPDGERTLAALGGERCACVDVLDAWARQSTELRVLTLASRGGSDAMRIAPSRQGWVGTAPYQSGPRAGRVSPRRLPRPGTRWARGGAFSSSVVLTGGPVPAAVGPAATSVTADDLVTLLELGPTLFDRLAVSVIAAWTERIEQGDPRCGDAGAALSAALFGRVTEAARSWLGDPSLWVEVDCVGPDTEPAAARGKTGVHFSLPFRWLRDVWAPGLALVLGRFSLDLEQSRTSRQRVLTVDRQFTERRPVTISLG